MYSNNILRERSARIPVKYFSKKETFQKKRLAFLEGAWYCSSVKFRSEYIRLGLLRNKRVAKINITALKIEVLFKEFT